MIDVIFMISFILTAAASLCSALLIAPLMAVLARRLGVVDRPDGHRKLHASAVPLTGGPTILLSVFAAMLVAKWSFPGLLGPDDGSLRFLLCLGGASCLIVFVGLLDDRFGLRGRQKLAGQFLAALVMVPSGIMIQRVELFGYPLEFGDVAPFVTLFWILGAINALNLIDGVDGLASTTGIILSLSVAAVTFILGGHSDGLFISLALAGSLCGFLVYNFPPARMFLGDSGSMLIGLILGCVALKCSVKQYAAVALIMPTAIWAIPIFDVAMAIVRRRLTGRSIYATDRGHLHHCLVRQGHTGVRLLVVVGFLCSVTGVGAVAGAAFGSDILAVIGVATALSLLIITRSFGHAELNLLTNRVRRYAGSLLKKAADPRPLLHDEQVRLHGEARWDELWSTLTSFAEEFEMDRVELLVNLPMLGEEYHATWQTRSAVEHHEAWRSEIPLLIDGLRVGHIKVAGGVGSGSLCEWMSELISGLRPFEEHLVSLIQTLRLQQTVATPVLRESASVRLSHSAVTSTS